MWRSSLAQQVGCYHGPSKHARHHQRGQALANNIIDADIQIMEYIVSLSEQGTKGKPLLVLVSFTRTFLVGGGGG